MVAKRAVDRPMGLLQAEERRRLDLSRRQASAQRVDPACGDHAGAVINPNRRVVIEQPERVGMNPDHN